MAEVDMGITCVVFFFQAKDGIRCLVRSRGLVEVYKRQKAALYVPERGAASTWVFTIARNLRIDRLRRESAAHFTDLEDFDAPSDDVPGDEAMNRSQEDSHVARALAQIPPEQRELLILSYVDDVPQSMIAERLNLPLGTVKSRMRLAYRRLRKLLEAVN